LRTFTIPKDPSIDLVPDEYFMVAFSQDGTLAHNDPQARHVTPRLHVGGVGPVTTPPKRYRAKAKGIVTCDFIPDPLSGKLHILTPHTITVGDRKG
jgi:hypothetical protein